MKKPSAISGRLVCRSVLLFLVSEPSTQHMRRAAARFCRVRPGPSGGSKRPHSLALHRALRRVLRLFCLRLRVRDRLRVAPALRAMP